MSKNEDKKKSFVMYYSFLEAMKHLNDSEFRECVMKIRDFALEGDETESEHPMVNIILAMAKPNLDAARRRYMASVENGKKGAEYGKLGGAPKGNQNARKNNPQSTPKQPLDVNVNEDIDEDVNEKVDVKVDDDGDTPSGSKGFQSSFSNSSIEFSNKEIENDNERLNEREEIKEPCSEERPSSSNDLEVDVAGEVKDENPIYSNSESINSVPVSTCSEKEAGCSAARHRRREVKGGVYDQGEYYRLCLNNFVLDLADMRMGILPQDDNLFWQTVNLYSNLHGVSDQKQAVKTITSMVAEIVQQSK